MGVAYKACCKHCSFQRDIYLGIGFIYFDLKALADSIQDPEVKQRVLLFAADESTEHNCYDALYVCRECCTMVNDLYMEITSDTDSFLRTYTCPKCSASMPEEPVNVTEATVLVCPDCGKEKLNLQLFMDWD